MRVPLFTLVLVSIAIVASVGPLPALLQYDRSLMHEPAGWLRLLSSQFTHWNADHLVWDALVLLIFGALAERRDRSQLILAVLLGLLLIPLAVHAFAPSIDTFRGLSGVDCVLFGLLLCHLLGDPDTSRRTKLASLAAAGGFVTKTAIEVHTSRPLFVQASDGFVVVPLAHLVGFAIGLCVGVVSFLRRLRRPRVAGMRRPEALRCPA